ncbi:glutathione S-transferase [Steroidobacter denitrificans]|uniref:Glutathione S-transferase n=1 Tax=Steroidobacter denitrificans TaxID=465721 RepID=A0A127F885_STEDE|nr:glutathione S-transferase family protein [Steroidobacter denitrificans]AMN45815.1 glutathione S-transferase [Steroidobacter denitrificans]
MALELWWGSGSPYSWRALLALEYKRLDYISHQVQFSKQEHQSPQLLAMNPRGRVPVLKDGDYVCFESLAILHYLERKYPTPPLFGHSAPEAGTITRVICEYQGYAEEHIQKIIYTILFQDMDGRMEEVERALGNVIGEARTIEARLSASSWLVGDSFSAADIVVFPGIQVLLRALERREARELRARLLPVEVNFPAIAAWIRRIEALPGYEHTYPPHWRE